MEDISSALNQYIATEIARQPQRVLAPEEPLITSGLIDSFHLWIWPCSLRTGLGSTSTMLS